MANQGTVPVWRDVGPTPPPVTAMEESKSLIVGGGPVGLTLALDLARRGHDVTILNRFDFVAAGSKAICFSKRTLDIWARLGVAAPVLEKGVVWNLGKVFRGADPEPVYQFDMLPVKDQRMPGFINLQQYHVEEILLAALDRYPNASVRWGHEVVGIEARTDGATVEVATAAGHYVIDTEWLIACDGSRSSVRTLLGLEFQGRVFEDNFLIADIRMEGERPSERWFWFDPPFNPGRSALLHKQPDHVWRLDFQLGWDIDKEDAIRPENVEPYVRGMLGPDVAFTPEWYSIYTFQCRRMASFVHRHVVFAGDSAHLVSPFGARGCNGGVADADNLGWKLDLILQGAAPAALLASYDHEAIVAADENILQSTRSTDFLTPKTRASQALRDAVLGLAGECSFARPFVNSGRLSTAVSYADSPLNTPDDPEDNWPQGIPPGSPALDAPLPNGWLLERLGGHFVLLTLGQLEGASPPEAIAHLDLQSMCGPDDLAVSRYGLLPGSAYLIRPDQYVAGRWRRPVPADIAGALARAKGAF